MPWEHCANTIDDHASCPTCGKSKTQWTVQWDVTRTFRLGKGKGAAGASELRFSLLDWKGDPAAGEPFVVLLPDGKEVEGKLSEYGFGKVPSPAGQGGLRFPRRKADELAAGQGVVAGAEGAEVPVDTDTKLELRLAAPRAKATLEVWQEAAALGERALLGSCSLEAPDARLDTTLADLGLGWQETDERPPFGAATITLGPGIAPKLLERNRSPKHLVRTRARRGGWPNAVKTAPPVDRGGDMFAPADTADAELYSARRWLKASHPHGEKALSVRVVLGAGKTKTTSALPVLHPPALLPVDQRYAELVLTLHLDLVLAAPEGREARTLAGPTFRLPAASFLQDAARVAANTLVSDLTIEYGNPTVPAGKKPLRPRTSMYELYEGKRGEAAFMARWREGCAAAADHVNAAMKKDEHHHPITAHDVGVTFLTEGGVVVLDHPGKKEPTFDGYSHLGIDEILIAYEANWQELQDYMHPDLVALAKDKKHVRTGFVNEGNDPVKTFTNLTIEAACHGVAAIVGHARRKFSKALADRAGKHGPGPWAGRVADLPPHLQFYWTTTFYNTKRAPKYLEEYGLEFHDRAWSEDDDHVAHSMQSKFNVSWRTATFRYFLAMSPAWNG